MRISYDEKVDALYIRFIDDPVQVISHRLTEDIAVNYDPDGEVVGIEILDASDHIFKKEKVRKVILENLQVV